MGRSRRRAVLDSVLRPPDTGPAVVAPVPAAALPPTLRAAIRAELRRAVRPPYETPGVVLGNGVLMTLCWTLLPPSLVGLVFSLHGPQAFAMVLASWMYSDVPATNLLGGDAGRAITALPDRTMLRRLWYAKNIVLWLMVTPLCVAVALVIGAVDGRAPTAALSAAWIVVVPIGALGAAAWVGAWFPYHPVPLRYRWARRRRWWPMLGRWAVLVLTPYGVVPALTFVVTLPALAIWLSAAPGGDRTRIPDSAFAWGLVAAAALAAIAWLGGHLLGARLAYRRRRRLAEFLADPERG